VSNRVALRSNAAGREERTGEFLLEHRAFVLRLCHIFLRDPQEAEDAAQQAFLHAYRALGEGVRPFNAKAWLAQIARNECRSRARRAAAHPEAPLSAGLAADIPDPVDLAAQHAFVARLGQELAELPERQREAMLLREFRGLSYSELAAAMDETGPAVESLLYRARRRLAERLDRSRRPLAGVALAVEPVRKVFARLLPGPGASEAATAAGTVAVVAKLTAAGVVAVGVGLATGDEPRVSHAPSTRAVVKIAPPAFAPSSALPPVRQSFRATARESEERSEADEGSSRGRGGGDDSRADDARGSSSPSESGSESAGEDSESSSSDSSGPGPGDEEWLSSREASDPGNSGPGSLSSGPGNGLESSPSGEPSDSSDSSGSDPGPDGVSGDGGSEPSSSDD